MRLFAVAIALLAAVPAFADEPAQVQLDVTVLNGPASMVDRAEIKSIMPKEFRGAGAISSRDAAKLVQIVREKCGFKRLAEPKLVTLIGRPAMFHVGSQEPIKTRDITEFEPVGTQIQINPNQFPGSDRIHLECHTSIRNRTQAGGINAQKMVAGVDLTPDQSLLIVHRECPTLNDRDPVRERAQATIIVITPQIVTVRSQPQTPTVDHAKHVAAMLVREYQQACKMQNAELATKLAHMAVELDPMCFNVAPPVAVTITAPPMSCPLAECNLQLFQPNLDFPVSGKLSTKEICDCLAIKVTNRSDPPTDAEVLAKYMSKCSAPSDEVEIVCEKIVDRVDPSRVFPLLGQAQLHHCQWKCTVYYNDFIGIKWPLKIGMKTQRTAVVYIDKDRLEK